ncbi:MAG: thiamine biosynthesis protein ThiF [Sulfurimonas sp.]
MNLDLNSPLVCEGLIGDGCGGGRIFFVEDAKLKVYDPFTKETAVLLELSSEVKSIKKSACIITIEYTEDTQEFDLSNIQS